MKIEKIKKLKSGKYKIELDQNQLVTYSDVILKNDILFKKEIGPDIINQLNIDTKYYDLYNKAVKYILKRIRSKKEVNTYLEKFDITEEEKEKIINDLEKLNLINDTLFTNSYVHDRFFLSKDGKKKIYNELKEHDIDDETIIDALEKITEEEVYNKLKDIIDKKIKANKNKSNRTLKVQITQELTNLGYDRTMIVEVFDSIDKSDTEAIKKEYDKQYCLLSKKYEGRELEYKIKQKLYQKGFDLSNLE